jgi:hypothetical protein
MPKQWIKVGACSQQFDVIPVKRIVDTIIPASKKSLALGWDRYQLLDIDGYFLVIHEWVTEGKASQEYVCFESEKQGHDYLEMCGMEKQEQDN